MIILKARDAVNGASIWLVWNSVEADRIRETNAGWARSAGRQPARDNATHGNVP